MSVKLGSLVRDLITGIEGIATARSEWLYGCNRIVIEQNELRDGKVIDGLWYDEQRVQVLQEDKISFVTPSLEAYNKISLGNKVRDKITGFSGIAVARTVWSSGSVNVSIEPDKLYEGKPIEPIAFDSSRCELIEAIKPPMSKSSVPNAPGGPQNDPKQAR